MKFMRIKKGKNRRFNERHDKVVKCMLCHNNDCRQNTSSFILFIDINVHEYHSSLVCEFFLIENFLITLDEKKEFYRKIYVFVVFQKVKKTTLKKTE
jgi:hypothetical protein